MFSPFQPVIAQEIFDLRKDYCALSVMAVNVRNNGEAGINSDLKGRLLASPPAWADAHLEAWREAYRQFGAKPQRTPPSADALIQRVRKDGQLPTINPVVDLYNTISVAFAIPIGGEDVAAYASSPTLMQATGGEHGVTSRNGFFSPLRLGGWGFPLPKRPEPTLGDAFVRMPVVVPGQMDVVPWQRGQML